MSDRIAIGEKVNAKIEPKPHSLEYFGEYRNFWWNQDFLELMVKRLNLATTTSILDVGCGIGHWGQTLLPLLSNEATLVGVDSEEAWPSKAYERAKTLGLEHRCSYHFGNVLSLPFPDNHFDLVTCQTLLIHLKDPKLGLNEMRRVLRPGGMLLVAEPNNFANRAIFTSLTVQDSVEEVVDRLRFDLTVEFGKRALGLGFNSLGDLIPGYFAEMGLSEISVYMSDKATAFFPPYITKQEIANISQMRSWAKRSFIGWDREEVFAYFMAGGGREEDFERFFDLYMQDLEKILDQIDLGTYHSAGGSIFYLISGRKKS